MPEAASSISARTMASRISGGTCAMKSERKASSSALSDIVFSLLDLGHAAIDVEFDSGHVTCFVRCKEGNSFGDLIGFSQSAPEEPFLRGPLSSLSASRPVAKCRRSECRYGPG